MLHYIRNFMGGVPYCIYNPLAKQNPSKVICPIVMFPPIYIIYYIYIVPRHNHPGINGIMLYLRLNYLVYVCVYGSVNANETNDNGPLGTCATHFFLLLLYIIRRNFLLFINFCISFPQKCCSLPYNSSKNPKC